MGRLYLSATSPKPALARECELRGLESKGTKETLFSRIQLDEAEKDAREEAYKRDVLRARQDRADARKAEGFKEDYPLRRVISRAQSDVEAAKTTKIKFIESFEKNPLYEIQWSESDFKTIEAGQIAQGILDMYESGDTLKEILSSLIYAMAREGGNMSSTMASSNSQARRKVEILSRLIGDLQRGVDYEEEVAARKAAGL